MKKIAYIIMFAGLLMTGCIEGDYGIKSADPQQWEQEEAITLPSSAVIAPVDPIDLAKVNGDSVSIASYTPLQIEEGDVALSLILDEKYKFNVREDMKVPVAELQAMVEDAYGKRPAARTFSAVLNANVIVEGQASLILSEPVNVVITPVAPFIASAYYLIGNMNGWDGEKAKNFQFYHSDKDIYEDPVFSIVIDVAENCYWKIIPQDNYDAGDVWRTGENGIVGVAVDGDDAAEGTLVTENPQAGKIPAAGMYTMTINMMDYTYQIKPKVISAEYYLVGALNGWNGSEEGKYCLLYPDPENSTMLQYTTKWEGDHNFKIWASADYGDWGKALGTAIDGDESPEGALVENAGAIKVPTGDEYYTVFVDVRNNTYKSVKLENQTPADYESISLIGDFNGWGGDADMEMKTPHNYVIRGLEVAADGGIKFRANHDWAVNWGTNVILDDVNYGIGTNGGDNIQISAGNYDVFFNDITGHFVFLKK